MAHSFTGMDEIGAMLRYHRERAGLTRIELATIAGVGKTVIYDVEHGKETVQLDTLQAICDALNVQLAFKSPLMQTYLNEREDA